MFLEEGAAPMGLYPGNHALEAHSGRVTILVWDAGRSVQRRVLAITARRPGRMDLEIQKFGAKPGTVTLFDASPRAQPHHGTPRRPGATSASSSGASCGATSRAGAWWS